MRYCVLWISLLELRFPLWKHDLQSEEENQINWKQVKHTSSSWIIWASKFPSLSFGAAIWSSVRGDLAGGATEHWEFWRVLPWCLTELGGASWASAYPRVGCVAPAKSSSEAPGAGLPTCQVSLEGERNKSYTIVSLSYSSQCLED